MAASPEYFVLTLPLKTERWQEDQLNKRLEVNRQIYNALLGKALKRYKQMCQTRRYRELTKRLDCESDAGERKKIFKELDELKVSYRLRRFDLTKDAAQYRKYFKENTDSPTIQNLALNVHKAMDKLIKGQAGQVHFKKEGELNSLSGKTNIASIMYRDGVICWKKLKMPVVTRANSAYERQALKSEIRYCRIKRQLIRGKWNYYVDLVLKGQCPVKAGKYSLQDGEVGLDMGVNRIAAVSDKEADILAMPRNPLREEYQKQKLMKQMERSRRAMNPQNYNENGTIQKGAHTWKESGHYKKLKSQYHELSRKQTIKRMEARQELVRKLMDFGNVFYIEDLDYEKLRRKSSLQLYRKNGAFKRKRGYGKEIGMSAPGALVNLLERKVQQQGGKVYKIDPVTAKAASLNHVTGETEVISLRRKWRRIQGIQINKYIYSAFLMKNADPETGNIDIEKCRADFEHFKKVYEQYRSEKNLAKAG